MSGTTGERPGVEPVPQDREAERQGREFVFAFHTAMRVLKLYPIENQAVQKALDELVSVARQLLEREGELSLHFVSDFCFVNDLRLRIDLTSYATFGAVGRALARHGATRIDVEPTASRQEWIVLLSLLLSEPAGGEGEDHWDGEACARLNERMRASDVTSIEVSAGGQAEQAERSRTPREVAHHAYVESVSVARAALLGVRMGRGVNVRRVKRAVQKIVDQVLTNENSILSMTALRDYDEYTFTHSVNVCIFSIALGKKLSLSRTELYELGLGALMHDVGKMNLPVELTNKPGPLTPDEWSQMREHPTEGLLELLEMNAIGELPLRAMLLAYEHHMKVDLSGYPDMIRPRDPTIFSRIVAVADGFDAATSKRSYQASPLLPDAVLREMRDNPGRGFDPLLVRAFISMTGFYPVGCCVILDSFELAVVVAPSTQPDRAHQPVVRILFDELGMPIVPARTLDLTELDPASGKPLRTIIKTTDPERYGIDPGAHIR